MSKKAARLLTYAIAFATVVAALVATRSAGAEPNYDEFSTRTPITTVVTSIPFWFKPIDGRKSLKVTATFPTDATRPYPLIVFSHGYGGSPAGYQHLIDDWAEHGYVVLAPTHADADALTNLAAIKTMGEKLSDPAACKQRVADMEDVLDSILLIEKQIPALKDKIDRTRIAAAGHSFGAYTSQLLGGAIVSYPGEPANQSLADKQLTCVLLLSPQGAGKMGLTPNSWDHMTIPAMTMTGSLDYPFAQKGGPATRLDPYKLAPAGDKYLVYIDNANHLTFCDVNSNQESRRPLLKRRHERAGMSQTEMYDYVKAASLAFFDAYLKGDTRGLNYLHSNDVEQTSRNIVHLSSK